MGTEDELRRCALAGAALAGAAISRAREVTEQLLGSRAQARREALRRAELLSKAGRQAAADVLASLRCELSAFLADMEHLEHSLRADAAAGDEPATEGEQVPGRPRPSRPRAQRPAASRPAGTTRPRARKATGGDRGR